MEKKNKKKISWRSDNQSRRYLPINSLLLLYFIIDDETEKLVPKKTAFLRFATMCN